MEDRELSPEEGGMTKTGECLYKIRNSWGTGCSLYRANLKKKCQGGYLEVEQQEFFNHSVGITTIE